MIGTSILKYFPKGPSNQQGAWYRGTVDDYRLDEGGVLWYHVSYDDGDEEFMTDTNLKLTFVGRRVCHLQIDGTVVGLTVGEDDTDLWLVEYTNGVREDVSFDELQEMLLNDEQA